MGDSEYSFCTWERIGLSAASSFFGFAIIWLKLY